MRSRNVTHFFMSEASSASLRVEIKNKIKKIFREAGGIITHCKH